MLQEVKKTRTTPYHPAGNGQAENANKTVKVLLMTKVEDEPQLWDEDFGASVMTTEVANTLKLGTQHLNWCLEEKFGFSLMSRWGLPETKADQYGECVSQPKGALWNALKNVSGATATERVF